MAVQIATANLTDSSVAQPSAHPTLDFPPQYMQRIQRHSQPLHLAKIRTFLFNGHKQWQMDAIVENIQMLLHASLFLFFVGLYIFLTGINIPVSRAVVTVVLLCLAFYGPETLAPLLDPFVASIPGLLSSRNGKETQATAFREASTDRLQNRVIRFLETSLVLLDPKARHFRAPICTEALFAIAQCERNGLPTHQTGYTNIATSI
ncbi:hypothetical protein DXG01_007616 [Tephrocybe rancida]|nr:hypothetical protein DXG01_007616 [Tephrocybe rancida]